MKQETINILTGLIKETLLSIEDTEVSDSNACSFPQTAFVFDKEGKMSVIVLPFDGKDKKEVLFSLGLQCYKKGIVRIALMMEVAIKSSTSEDIDPSEMPLAYPPEMRKEAIIIQYMNLQDGNDQCMLVQPYSIINNKVKKNSSELQTHAKYQSGILRTVLSGFVKHYITSRIEKHKVEDLTEELAISIVTELKKEYPALTDISEFFL